MFINDKTQAIAWVFGLVFNTLLLLSKLNLKVLCYIKPS
jgi:hypothetical protein